MTAHRNDIDMDSLIERLADAEIPGNFAEFTDEEAELLGAFDDDAISAENAVSGSYHNPELIAEVMLRLKNES